MELTLKTSWKAVTIREYMNYKNALDNPNTSDFEKNVEILAVLLNVDAQFLLELPAKEILPLFNRMDFLTESPKDDAQPYYTIAGKTYKLIMDVKDLTAAQFIDLSYYTKDAALIIDNIHSICATLLIPVKPYRGKKADPPTEKYGETPIQETAEFLYENMSIMEAVGISTFFTHLFNLFTLITQHYLEAEMETQLNKASKMLKPNTMETLKKRVRGIGFTKNGNGSR